MDNQAGILREKGWIFTWGEWIIFFLFIKLVEVTDLGSGG
jgi:hypothetical protein